MVDRFEREYSDHLRPVCHEGLKLYDWTLFWLISADLISGIGSLIHGEVADDWYFDDMPLTGRLFTNTRLKTVNMMVRAFKHLTGNPNATEVLLTSYLNGESKQQTVARLQAGGVGLREV